jgi:hypothetical protein
MMVALPELEPGTYTIGASLTIGAGASEHGRATITV